MITRSTSVPDDVRSIIILQAQGLGDLVMTTPLLRATRERWPKARITLAVGSRAAADLMAPSDLIDDVSVMPPRRSWRFGVWCLKMRQRKYQIAIVATWNSPLWPPLLRTVMGIRQIAADGKADASRYATWYRQMPSGEPCVISNFELIERVTGLASLRREPELELDSGALRAANAMIADFHLQETALILGVHPGSEPAVRQKRYPVAQLRETITILLDAMPQLQVLAFFGGEPDDDREQYRDLHSRIHLIEDVPIRVVAALLQRCQAVLSGDTGLAHIAAALAVRTIVIAGPTPVASTRPWGDRSELLFTDDARVQCIPCFGTNLYGTCTHISCMTTLPPNRVAQVVITGFANDGHFAADH